MNTRCLVHVARVTFKGRFFKSTTGVTEIAGFGDEDIINELKKCSDEAGRIKSRVLKFLIKIYIVCHLKKHE